MFASPPLATSAEGEKSRSWETREKATSLVQMGNDGGCGHMSAREGYFCIYSEGEISISYGPDLGDERR